MSGGNDGNEAPVTQEERATAEKGAKEYNSYRKNYVPLLTSLKDRVRSTDTEIDQVQGSANADAAAANEGRFTNTLRSGYNTSGANSGNSIIRLNNTAIKQGVDSGNATSNSTRGARDVELAGLRRIASIGRNLEDSNNVSLRKSASEASVRSIRRAENNYIKDSSNKEAVGAAAGTYLAFRK